jgi:dihydropteroate synthase type 2
MHSVQRSGPATIVSTDPAESLERIKQFFAERLGALRAAGIARDRLIIDPGPGYFLGSNPEPSLVVMGALRQLRAKFGVPVLVSPSCKSFLRNVTGRAIADIGPASVAAEPYAAAQRVDYLRTRDVAALRDALTVRNAIAATAER